MNLSARSKIAALTAAACLAGVCTFVSLRITKILHQIPTAPDAQQSLSLYRHVITRVVFDEQSRMDPGQPPVYTSPGRNSARLLVYGLTNAARQEEVLSAVREWQATNRNMATISVRFYEHENWRQFTNSQSGYSGGQRLEVLLREVSVVLSDDASSRVTGSTGSTQ